MSPGYCPTKGKDHSPVQKKESCVIPAEASKLLTLQLEKTNSGGFGKGLRKLSEAFFHQQQGAGQIDLMNDWEIGGTQNKWVCPSDRHLQLRAQLKSGWSVRTATARSPTNSKTQVAISDAEQEQIRKVLERVEESKRREQQRIGKMVDRLDKMRRRATGNGVTHCLLCHTEFGLLASKSYAAMCTDCRKYVCQRNCGVETLDSQRGEVVFLCKICAEARELWKKSGAWFYREMPEFVKPEMRPGTAGTSTIPMSPPATSGMNGVVGSSRNGSLRRQLPTPPTTLTPDRTKSPRPRITPSWVKEKVMSSMSVEDDDRSSSDGDNFVSSGVVRRRKDLPHKQTSLSRREANLQRFAAMASQHLSDSEDDSSPESRASTRSTSPRRSLATPSSYDSAHHPTIQPSSQHAEDARSIDSGVVQSDHSNPQAALTLSVSSLAPLASGTDSGHPRADTASPRRISQESARDLNVNGRESLDRESPLVPISSSRTSLAREAARVPASISGTCLVTPPPLAPRRESPLDLRKLSISSAASTRRAANSTESMNLIDAIKASNNVRSDSPSAAFMSSPDDDSKIRRGALTRASWRERAASRAVEDSAVARGIRPPATRALSDRDSSAAPFGGEASGTSSPPVRRSASGLESSSTSSLATTVPSEPGSELHAKRKGERRATVLACFLPRTSNSTLGSIQFNIMYLHEQKQLVVNLVKAKNLKAMDKNGFSDPYVKLHLIPGNAKATKLTSKTIEKTLNPEWNEELTYYGVTEEDRQRKTLRVTVLDRDRIGSDFLGETRVALKKLPINQMKKFNLYLEHAIPVQQEKKESEAGDRGKALVALTYNIQQGSLFVHVKRCSELIGMDSSGFSDPYCKVSLTPITSKSHRLRTSIKKRTLNPEWSETLTFIVPFKDLPKKTLQIGIYDHDVGSRDDYIGGILLSASAKGERGKQWIQTIENPGQTFEYWHKLELDN